MTYDAPPDGAVRPDNDLERAVLEADDWRLPISAVPFELDALLAVRKRASLDAARDLQAGTARRYGVGAPESGQRFDCPQCMQTWSSGAELSTCPRCGSGLIRHSALPGEPDEAALSYRTAYDEAVLAAVRQSCPHFAWHLLHEAPESAQARLAGESGLPLEIAALAWDVSSGDETGARELLGWLGQRLGSNPEGDPVQAAQAALAEIGAEVDEREVEGRRRAEELLRQGALVRHAAEPHHFCPSCMKRWVSEGEPPSACALCGGPLVLEQPLGEESDERQRAVLEALNARIDKHLRAAIAPGYDPGQLEAV